MSLGLKLESIAWYLPEFSRFALILILLSPWLSKGIASSSYQEVPKSPISLWRGHVGALL